MRNVNETIDPLQVTEVILRLKSSIAATTAAENAVLRAKAGKLAALRRDAQKHEESAAAVLDGEIHAIREDFQRQSEVIQASAAARSARSQQAYHASKAAMAREIQQSKDLRIGKVQGDIMRRRQVRQQELEQAAATNEAFQKSLNDARVERREIRSRFLSTFRAFGVLVNPKFQGKGQHGAMEAGPTPEKTRGILLDTLESAREVAESAGKLPLVAFFRYVPPTLLAVVVIAVHLGIGYRAGDGGFQTVLPSLLIFVVLIVAAWIGAFISSSALVKRGAELLAGARVLESKAAKQSAERLAQLEEEMKSAEAEEGKSLSETFRESGEAWRQGLATGQQRLEERFKRLPARMDALYQKRFSRLDERCEAEISAARAVSQKRVAEFTAAQEEEKSGIESEAALEIAKLSEAWSREVVPMMDQLVGSQKESLMVFPEWNAESCRAWQPPEQAPEAVRLGSLLLDAGKLAGGLPSAASFPVAEAGRFSVPFALGFPNQGSLMIETEGPDDGTGARILQAAALRIIATQPPGRASFLFIDPVGLGKDFAGLMHLADYEESLITSRIWTQSTHIEERLAEINEHIEKVIQMYLRDEYADINAYNLQAGTIAEKYRFLVIAGFPASFSDTAARRLRSIASGGARCGVHLLIQRDSRLPSPDPALDEELRRVCRRVAVRDGVFHLTDAPAGAEVVEFDPAPLPQDSLELVHRIGRSSVDSNRVQVPFSQIAPPAGEEWTLDTSDELRVPIGRTGAKKLQMLAIGKGTRQHMLVAGKTGSGKSTLFHVIITNLARWASPQQVEFYLVDFKKGVEFKCYAGKHLPHARVVAIESDREFALSVLQRVDAELKRRGELFRMAGAQDVAGYKRTSGAQALPRTLLLIDEFQEFFTEDDAVAQEASLLLDRIVRQGRAFGIHVILGSQTLGGAYTLARATLGQMVIRVALQCNEADAHLIMDDDNPAPRLLTRPGEGIYNDQAGALAANSPFQIVWLPEDERDRVLDEVYARAKSGAAAFEGPIVFEGNAPADITDSGEMAKVLVSRPVTRPKKSHAWLGAPNSIKGPTEAVFQRQSGSHLLVIGQSAERSLALLTVSTAALAMQFPKGQAEFVILDPHASEGEGWYHRLAKALPQNVRVGGPAEVAELMNSLAAELAARAPTSGKDAPEVFLVVQDLQRFKALRPDDDFKFSFDEDGGAASPSKVFADLLGEGGPCGMHVIVATDTWNNVSRWIPRKLMAEFEMRVLFQMSANDSANLIDSPAASTLGLHRALFFNEHLGTLETFRPYALPDGSWVDSLGEGAIA